MNEWTNSSGAAVGIGIAKTEVHLWLTSLQQPDDVLTALDSVLTPEERARAARFHFEADRRRFMVAHGVLRDILGHHLGIAPVQVPIEPGAAGKPRIAVGTKGASSMQFNLSHTRELALIALAADRCVGVDIEPVRPGNESLDFIVENLSPLEQRDLAALPGGWHGEACIHAWVCKEAYVKALGLGLGVPLRSFSVQVNPDLPAALLEPAVEHDRSAWQVRALSIDSATPHFGAVFVQGQDEAVFRRWRWSGVLRA